MMRHFFIGCVLLAQVLLYGAANASNQPQAIPIIAYKPMTDAVNVRGAEQTLLTFPEWFLVFSPYEYGEFIATQRPSNFPLYTHIGQFWNSYRVVTTETQKRSLNPNPGYHLMIMVIGVSTSVEYAIKSAYETLIGRFTEGLGGHDTQEDKYAVQVAQDYVKFIRELPWYEYNFAAKLRGLWSNTDLFGSSLMRKWERKFALTTEYSIKMIYGKLIKIGTKSIYDAPLMTTTIVLDRAPTSTTNLPDFKLLQTLTSSQVLATVPRYEGFTHYAQALANDDLNFQEIAGNNNFILVSILTDKNLQLTAGASNLFAQNISTKQGLHRLAIMLPVSELANALRIWKTEGVLVEHVFDY